jgi:translation initiation factor 1 (eIF-1/SUI1)
MTVCCTCCLLVCEEEKSANIKSKILFQEETMTEKKRLKPIKIEWEGNLAFNSKENPVLVKGTNNIKSNNERKESTKISGKVNIRKETKGRAGKPVAIIFNFSDIEAKKEESLNHLCSQLKNSLACGGTVENGEIILTLRDFNKLKDILLKFDIIAL